MKVVLQVSGGLAPSVMGRRSVVDTAALDAADEQVLSSAVDAALAQPPRPANPRARDVRTYEITIHSDTGTHTIVAEDGAVAPEVRRLIDTITALSPT
jgi:hypothetical protein